MTTYIPRQHYPEQGGVYIGPRLIDGKTHHCFIPEHERVHSKFDAIAPAIASLGEINGHNDWRMADMEDGMLAFINARDLFPSSGSESVIWLNKPYGSTLAWALGFEGGDVDVGTRSSEFAGLPVRSVVVESGGV